MEGLTAGPRQAAATVPSLADEAIAGPFRKHTLLRWTIAFAAAAAGFEAEYDHYQKATMPAALYALSQSLFRDRENSVSAARVRAQSMAPLWS
jgi:hypothetical protein